MSVPRSKDFRNTHLKPIHHLNCFEERVNPASLRSKLLPDRFANPKDLTSLTSNNLNRFRLCVQKSEDLIHYTVYNLNVVTQLKLSNFSNPAGRFLQSLKA